MGVCRIIWQSGPPPLGNTYQEVGVDGVSLSDGGTSRITVRTFSDDGVILAETPVASVPNAPVATQLGFAVNANDTQKDVLLVPPFVVERQDDNGAPAGGAGFSETISISEYFPPAGNPTQPQGNLLGTLTKVTDAAGQAIFDDLTIDAYGTYILKAEEGTTALSFLVEPANSTDGVAFGTQAKVYVGANGVTVTLTKVGGTGTLVNATAVSDGSLSATFQRTRIDGGVGSSHEIVATAVGYDNSPSTFITPVAAPTPGTIVVDESTEFRQWRGHYPTASTYPYESTQDQLDNDTIPHAIMWRDELGPSTWIVSWRPGIQSSTDWTTFYGPWPNAANWVTLRNALRANWEAGATIWMTSIQLDLETTFIPVRNAALAVGADPPKMQLLMQTSLAEPTAFRPLDSLGDQDGSTYAAIVLAIFQWMNTTYGFVPDEVCIINEPNVSANSRWTANDIGLAMAATQTALAGAGFYPKFSAPCVSVETYTTIETWYNTIKSYVPAGTIKFLNWHRYGGRDATNRALIKTLCDTEGIDPTMTEWIIQSGTGEQSFEQCIGDADSVSWAILAASGYVTRPGDGNVQIAADAWYIPQYTGALRRGAIRIGCTESSGNLVSSFCWVNLDGKHVVAARTTAAGTYTISGLPAGTYDAFETTVSLRYNSIGPVVVANGGKATVSPTAAGVFTLRRL